MREYVWLFPVIFMFHEMEEIVGFNFFLKKNGEEIKKLYPRIYSKYKDFSTEGFALATYEEFIMCILVCLLAYFLDYNWLWYLWLGAFLGCDLHFFIHLLQAGIFKKYIPACITSVICLPVNTLIICRCLSEIKEQSYIPAIFIILGVILVCLNLRFAISIIGWFTRKTEKA